VLGLALSQSVVTFLVGLLLAAAFFGLCRVAGWFYEQSLRKCERPERFEPMDFADEIRVIDRTRRGPDARSVA
jgi:hypothetical protein